jgi:hypothetical protein
VNLVREIFEFTIAIFVSTQLSLLTTYAFKQLREWWRDRQWRKDIAWLEETNKRSIDVMLKK